jgi:hypothetical protein
LSARSREHDLVLALARGSSGAALAGERLAGIDFDALTEILTRLRLLGLLGQRLLQTVLEGQVPETFGSAVQRILTLGARDAVHKQMIARKLWHELEDAGIAAIPLKGPFLAERLFGGGAGRLSADIDLLVSRRDASRALKVLSASGLVWRADPGTPLLHYVLDGPYGIPVELHWRVTWYESFFADAMLARSTVEGDVRRPVAADELLTLLLIHARDGLAGLRMPVDVARWWTMYGPQLPRFALQELVVAHPALSRAATAAAISIQEAALVPLFDELLLGVQVDRRTWAATRLADPLLLADREVRDRRIKVVDGLLTDWRGAGRYVKRAMFPRLPGPSRGATRRRMLHALVLAAEGTPIALRALSCSRDRPSAQRHQ